MRGAEAVVGVDGCRVAPEPQKNDQAGFEDVEGTLARVLCRAPGAGMRVSEAWGERQVGRSGVWKPEPGGWTLTEPDEGTQGEGWMTRAAAERGLGSVEDQ